MDNRVVSKVVKSFETSGGRGVAVALDPVEALRYE
jgi:hypothetical protein